jgi:hypothetical protein
MRPKNVTMTDNEFPLSDSIQQTKPHPSSSHNSRANKTSIDEKENHVHLRQRSRCVPPRLVYGWPVEWPVHCCCDCYSSYNHQGYQGSNQTSNQNAYQNAYQNANQNANQSSNQGEIYSEEDCVWHSLHHCF